MVESNPYAPSAASLDSPAELAAGRGLGPWRDGELLVMEHTSVLPARCVKCNEPAAEPTPLRRLFWHPRGYFALLLISAPIYIVVAMIVRRKASVSPGLCERHKRRRRGFLWLGWLGLVGFFAMTILLDVLQGSLAPVGFIVTLVAMVIGAIGARIVRPVSIDPQYVRLRGCGDAFLNTLAPFVR